MLNDFLNLLFDPDQTTCYAPTANGYRVYHSPADADIFFSINALHPYKDLNPTKAWHDENLPRRSDLNVVCHRNFLIEIDSMPLDLQISYVREKVPVSSIVYSGGSSYHFIISLTDNVTAEQYKIIAQQLHDLLPKSDPHCKNASRLSRLPYRFRPETGKEQKLIYLGQRIALEDLEPLLPPARQPFTPFYDPNDKDAVRQFTSPLIISLSMEPDAFMRERNIQGRNALFYYLGCRFEEAEYDQERRIKYVTLAYNNLQDTSNFTFEEALLAARTGSQ